MAPGPPGDPRPVAGAGGGAQSSGRRGARPAHRPAPCPADASDRGARGGRRVCFLQVQSRRLEALAGRAGPNGNFLNNDQWLSTVSQYDRDKYWNRFRDVSTGGGSLREGPEAGGGLRRPPGQLAGPGSQAVLPEKNFEGALGRPAPLGLLPVVQVCVFVGRVEATRLSVE